MAYGICAFCSGMQDITFVSCRSARVAFRSDSAWAAWVFSNSLHVNSKSSSNSLPRAGADKDCVLTQLGELPIVSCCWRLPALPASPVPQEWNRGL
eukprot:800368-Pelagomonas_calceolata.AAC.6